MERYLLNFPATLVVPIGSLPDLLFPTCPVFLLQYVFKIAKRILDIRREILYRCKICQRSLNMFFLLVRRNLLECCCDNLKILQESVQL